MSSDREGGKASQDSVINNFILGFKNKYDSLYRDPETSSLKEFKQKKKLLDQFKSEIDYIKHDLMKAFKLYDDCKQTFDHQANEITKILIDEPELPPPSTSASTNKKQNWASLVALAENHNHDDSDEAKEDSNDTKIKRKIREDNLQQNLIQVKVSNRFTIPAFKVDSAKEAPLYRLAYCDTTREFILRVTTDVIIRGNIGEIFTESNGLMNVRICTYQDKCKNRKSCHFWHDPTKTTSDDVMNFTAKSWMYEPETVGRRRFGNHKTLDEDIAGLTSDDVTILTRQTMHDILCCIILQRYVNRFNN